MIRPLRCPSTHWAFAVLLVLLGGSRAGAYIPDTRWSNTASGSTGTQGTPITLTWSLLRDGTNIPTEGASNLIDYFDDLFNVTSTTGSLTARPWFHLFQESFDRWGQLGGITFVYEANDSGTFSTSNSNGSLGVRGDIRIGGANIDGPSGTLAYTYLPQSGDMVVDTGETTFYANSNNNYRAFRNTLMHEIGHAIGFDHIESSTDNLLMEPFINTSFDGPQLDDIRAIQGYYGDPLEKGLGNDTSARATSLGSLAIGGSRAIGSHAVGGQSVSPTETDFVSIDANTDTDFYSFTIATPVRLSATLTPLGGIFSQGPEDGDESSFNANARNDLTLAVFGTNGTTLLASANLTPAGQAEVLNDIALNAAGTYFARITGSTANVQLYQLQLSAAALVIPLAGDYNHDNVVDTADYAVWRNSLGATGTGLAADGDNNGVVDSLDYNIWKGNFGATQSGTTALVTNLATVPEPGSAVLGILFAAAILLIPKPPTRRRSSWLRPITPSAPVAAPAAR